MKKALKEYIELNKLCSEYLFADWLGFLTVLYENNGRVEAILWFEHILICRQKESLGAGGYLDKQNPEYMYAETQIYENGFEKKSFEEVKDYILATLKKYPGNNLVPAFYITE